MTNNNNKRKRIMSSIQGNAPPPTATASPSTNNKKKKRKNKKKKQKTNNATAATTSTSAPSPSSSPAKKQPPSPSPSSPAKTAPTASLAATIKQISTTLETAKTKAKKKKNKKKTKNANATPSAPPPPVAPTSPSQQQQQNKPKSSSSSSASLSPFSTSSNLSALQIKMKARLEGARFRDINEMLYTNSGDHALSTFSKEPELFDAYHKGFREQVAKWPCNPLDDMIAWVQKQPHTHTIADFGCGEARLATCCPKHKVYSFDLVAQNEHVIACDIAKVPLPKESVDVVVFCLSLMGTNMMDFLVEAGRVLKVGGVVKVAEVRSRFEGGEGAGEGGGSKGGDTHTHTHGNDGIEAFLNACQKVGFECKRVDKKNKMFFMVDLVKRGQVGGREVEAGRGGGGGGGGGGRGGGGGGGGGRGGGGRGGRGGRGGGGRGSHQSSNKPATPGFQAKPCIYKRR